jgi:hypothetical protein
VRRPALSLLLVLLVACGASQREKTIRATFNATTVAADSLVAFSRTHEMAIVDAATSKEEGKAKLAEFRAKVDKAELTLTAVYRMTAAASLANDDQSLAALLKVAQMLWAQLKELGVPL